jgi:hypothetical protein
MIPPSRQLPAASNSKVGAIFVNFAMAHDPCNMASNVVFSRETNYLLSEYVCLFYSHCIKSTRTKTQLSNNFWGAISPAFMSFFA